MNRAHKEMMKHHLKRKSHLEQLYPRTVSTSFYNLTPLSLIVQMLKISIEPRDMTFQ